MRTRQLLIVASAVLLLSPMIWAQAGTKPTRRAVAVRSCVVSERRQSAQWRTCRVEPDCGEACRSEPHASAL